MCAVSTLLDACKCACKAFHVPRVCVQGMSRAVTVRARHVMCRECACKACHVP